MAGSLPFRDDAVGEIVGPESVSVSSVKESDDLESGSILLEDVFHFGDSDIVKRREVDRRAAEFAVSLARSELRV